MKTRTIHIVKHILICIVVFSSLHINSISQVEETATLENVLSVYIYNFSKFIQWPSDQQNNFNICIWGKNKIVTPLEAIAKREKVNGRQIEVTEVMQSSEIKKCNILYYPGNNQRELLRIMNYVKGKEILLVTNSEGFAEKGAGINFINMDDKIKFEINKKVLEENNIIPNSRLLSLAVNVYE